MKKIEVILTLAVALSYVTISSVQADPLQVGQAAACMNNSVKAAPLPVWKITQDGTADCVTWVDANNPRFAVYDTNGDSTADRATWVDDVVLDKETGLVWERNPTEHPNTDWYNASLTAYNMYLGGRKGWRLPTVEEFMSLLVQGGIIFQYGALPIPHPFGHFPNADHLGPTWTSTPFQQYDIRDRMWIVDSQLGTANDSLKSDYARVWCVLGGLGHHGIEGLPF